MITKREIVTIAVLLLMAGFVHAQKSDGAKALKTGNQLFNEGKYQLAIESYMRAIAENPLIAGAHYNIGRSYQQLRQPKLALEYYSKAIERNPRNADAFYNRGAMAYKSGRLSEAVSDLSASIDLRRLPDVYFVRALAYSKTGKYRKALSDLTNAIMLDGRFDDAYFNRGLIRHRLGYFGSAAEDFSAAIRIRPKTIRYFSRGQSRAKAGATKAALADFRHTLKLDPRFARAHNECGNVFYKLNKFRQAIDEYTSAIAISPKHQYHFNRAMAYVGLGDSEAAIADLTSAVSIFPRFAKGYALRGKLYKEIGKHTLALADAEKAGRLDPGLEALSSTKGLTGTKEHR